MLRDTLGRYQLLTLLASGGMAEVYLACMPGVGGFRKFVALKQVLPDVRQNELFVNMFLDEARLTAELNHPNIGQVFELGQEDEELFLAMEFISGVTLEQLLLRAERVHRLIPHGFSCKVMVDACRGLHYAHTFVDSATGQPKPIVHRDVSPRNVMVTFDGLVKVIDFGIAKARGRLVRTQVGQVKGTVPYMSPEQVSEGQLDGRSDVFSLGVVLWELLTGRPLHADANPKTMLSILQDDAPPPSSVANVPPALDAVVAKALARDPAQRFESALDMARAVEQACPSLFNEEQAAAFVTELMPETRQALRQMLKAAQKDDVDTKYLDKQAKLLRKADTAAMPSLPAPIQLVNVVQAKIPRSGVVLAAGLGLLAVLGAAGVLLNGSAQPVPADKPAAQGLSDVERERHFLEQADARLKQLDIQGAYDVLNGCRRGGVPCPGVVAALERVKALRANPCADGTLVEVLVARARAQIDAGAAEAARPLLESCSFNGRIHPSAQAALDSIPPPPPPVDKLDRPLSEEEIVEFLRAKSFAERLLRLRTAVETKGFVPLRIPLTRMEERCREAKTLRTLNACDEELTVLSKQIPFLGR